MKMSRFITTQLVAALSLCLLLLGFSYSAEAAARPITDDAGAASRVAPQGCDFRGSCANDDDCRRICTPLGYGGGYCVLAAASSSNGEAPEKIDVNRYHVAYSRCCCS
ncbi:hypothetical protein MKX01_020590 [Papaver californicum]|nr:hypothetical protein MKX01_020590 [Papaver californicum]